MGINKKYGEYGSTSSQRKSSDKEYTAKANSGYGKFYRKTKFRPKKPVRGFRDLEIYQRAQELVLLVKTKVVPLIRGNEDLPVREIKEAVSGIPEKIAEAHSRRFEDKKKAIELLNDAKADCNKLTVYVDQVASMPVIDPISAETSVKDEDNVGSGTQELCWDLIKRLGTLRMKIYNLQKAWQKFWAEDKNKKL